MAKRKTSKRKKGPQTPSKYPIPVGQNYEYWGEQSGYVYDPWADKYIADPNLQREYGEQTGLTEKKPKVEKPPGVWEQSAATILPALVSQGGLLALKSYLTPSTGVGAGPYSGGNVYDYPGGPLDATSASGGIYPQSGLLGLENATPDITIPSVSMSDFSIPEVSGIGPVASGDEYGSMLQNNALDSLDNLYQDSYLQSGVNYLSGLLGLG